VALPLAAQSGDEPSYLQREIAGIRGLLIDACPAPAGVDLDALVADEREIEFRTLKSTDDPAAWFALACARARLATVDAIANEGLAMLPGASWGEGAAAALVEGIQRDPSNTDAASLLGILALDEYGDGLRRAIGEALQAAGAAGVRSRLGLRGCSELMRRAGRVTEAQQCTAAALAAGLDSTWQLLEQARYRFRAADTAGGQVLVVRAVASIRDSLDRAAVEWHLRWMTEPEERVAWDGLADNARATWVRDLFVERDLRDGRPAGSRMAAHFERLEVVDTLFRLRRTLRESRRFELAATPENGAAPDAIINWTSSDPAVIPARAFRFYLRAHPRFDDRVAVWMRWGPPQERRVARPNDIDLKILNSREGWLYDVPGGSIVLSFEGEDFDASGEAVRLVERVLGFYFCGMDTQRCNLTNRSNSAGLTPEALEELAVADRQLIDLATTRDGNAPVPEHRLTVAANMSRVWDPATGEVFGVASYAIRARDLGGASDDPNAEELLVLRFRQWDPSGGQLRTKTDARLVTLPDPLPDDAQFTGSLVVPSSAAVSAWSLAATQGDDHEGHAWGRGLPRLDAGGLSLSDLIVGAASQGVHWTSPSGARIALGPLGAFDRSKPISLYWQVHSEVAGDARVRIALFREGQRVAAELEIALTERVAAGYDDIVRDLDLSNLEKGAYRIVVTVTPPDGGAPVRREAALLLW
jgi:hypothetical protein